MITITFSEGLMLVDGLHRYSLDFEAYCLGDEVGVRHISLPDVNIYKGRVKYDQIRINGVVYGSAVETVYAFNAHTAAALAYLWTGLKANSEYPNTPFSATLTPNAETRLANYAYPRYIYVRARNANGGFVRVGPAGLSAANGGTLTARGVCWSTTNTSPTITDNRTIYTASVGSFTDVLRGLRGNTTYYARAYAITAEGGTSYGDVISFTTPIYSQGKTSGKIGMTNGKRGVNK